MVAAGPLPKRDFGRYQGVVGGGSGAARRACIRRARKLTPAAAISAKARPPRTRSGIGIESAVLGPSFFASQWKRPPPVPPVPFGPPPPFEPPIGSTSVSPVTCPP